MKRPPFFSSLSCLGDVVFRWTVLSLVSGLMVGTTWAQALRGGTQAGPSFDDLPVVTYRMVIVESSQPLVAHGIQLSEGDFSTRLQQWRTGGMAQVVVDRGFILPEGSQPIDPNFTAAGGRAVMMGPQDNRSPGPAMRMRTERTAEGYRSEIKLSIWAMSGHTLRDSLATLENPSLVAGSAQIGGQGARIERVPCEQGPEVEHAWESPLRTVTGLVCRTGSGGRSYCHVFLNPISARPSWVDQPGVPKQYQSATLKMVGGAVSSGAFWSYIKNTRPDIIRPRVMGGGILELFWSDDDWAAFTQATQQSGTAWANLPDAKLTAERPSVKLNSAQIGVTVSLAGELPSQGYLLKLDCPTLTAEGPGGKMTGDQFGISLPALCESHQRRWVLFARLAGDVTYLLAMRPEFDEAASAYASMAPRPAPASAGMPAPAKAVAVVEDVPATASLPAPASLPEPVVQPLVPASEALRLYEGQWEGTIDGRPNARMAISALWDDKREELTRDTKIEMEPGYSRPIYNTTVMKRNGATGKFQSKLVPLRNVPPTMADGDWDPASRTFTWRALDERTGSTMVTTAVFPRDGVMEWRQVLTHSDGKEGVNERGRAVRVKKAAY